MAGINRLQRAQSVLISDSDGGSTCEWMLLLSWAPSAANERPEMRGSDKLRGGCYWPVDSVPSSVIISRRKSQPRVFNGRFNDKFKKLKGVRIADGMNFMVNWCRIVSIMLRIH